MGDDGPLNRADAIADAIEAFALATTRRDLLALLEALLERRAGNTVDHWVARLQTLQQRQLRRHRVVELLNQCCDQLAFLIVRGLWHSSRRGDPLAREVLLDLLTWRPLTESLGYDTIRSLYARAHARGEPEVGRLFLSAPAEASRGKKFGLDVENRAMIDTSLGLRKAYARGADRFKIDRLLFDLNPAVIRNLLRNPRIVEQDVVRIAALRPTKAEVIHEIHCSERWISRYAVKKAIVFNPYAPIDISLALLPHLLRPDLVDATNTSLLSPDLKDAARRLLDEKP